MSEESYIQDLARQAKEDSHKMRVLTRQDKDRILGQIARLIQERSDFLKQENQKDLDQGKERELSAALLDRLELTDKRIDAMARGVEEVIQLEDPAGQTTPFRVLPNGIRLGQVYVPLGVVAVIYESRPNVTIDVAALCIKSGNVPLLRGGSEAFHSNQALYDILQEAFRAEGLEPMAYMVAKTERQYIQELLKLDQFIDVVVPRGGYGLIQTVTDLSRIPVIKHDAGICHTYVAADAPKEMAEQIALNAKVSRPGTCNAMETLLLDKNYPYKEEILQAFANEGVKIMGCPQVREIFPSAEEVTDQDFATEWLDLILNVRIVAGVANAISHIQKFSSQHSEAIVSQDYQLIADFSHRVDSAAVFVNSSTRFHDGGQFGLGAEVGISTQKLHVRGPMALEHLVTTKYLVMGNGQIRD